MSTSRIVIQNLEHVTLHHATACPGTLVAYERIRGKDARLTNVLPALDLLQKQLLRRLGDLRPLMALWLIATIRRMQISAIP